MEIDHKNEKSLATRAYIDHFNSRAITYVISISVAAALFVIIVLSAMQVILLGSIAFWIVSLILLVLLPSINMVLFTILLRPFRELVHTIISIEESATKSVPAVDHTTYSDEGFKEIIKTLHELVKSKPTTVIEKQTTANDLLRTGLDETSSGVIILDSDRTIIYNNKKAPVRIDQNGVKHIELIFPESDTLDDWLNQREDNSIHAENIWTRVGDKIPGEHNRHLYDVVASYQKGNMAETVLTLLDRTSTYAPEEDDLDFISFAAHELRGPITVIRGYLDVISEELKPVLKDDQTELLQRLTVSANRLSSYINNILNASSYDRRHFKVRLNEENLSDIYTTIQDDMRLRAISQNRILTIDIPSTLPTIAADKNSIGEVMSNLIDNAIKYSNEGGQVIVQARAVSQFVEVSVIDRGIGMPSSVLPNLFHKFYRSHRSRETVAGTGIGLYISKAIIESHGGTIEVRSTESEGSTFSFKLPIYSTVAEKIKAGNNSNELLIGHGGGWIRNHSMYRG